MKGLFWKAFITVRVGIRLHCSSPLTEHGFLSMDSRCFVNPSVPGRVYPSVRIRGECWFVWVTHSDSILLVSSVQFSYSVVSDSLPPHGLQYARPPYHQLLEFTQIHVHWVGDAIQPSHPLSSPSPPAFNLSQHEGLFKWVSSSLQVAKVLEFQLQHQSFQWIFRTDFL